MLKRPCALRVGRGAREGEKDQRAVARARASSASALLFSLGRSVPSDIDLFQGVAYSLETPIQTLSNAH